MQRVQPNPATILPVTTSIPTENNSCCTRMAKIALAIFVSLAAFVFLPVGVALTLSVIVTLGAIGCNENEAPAEVPSPQSKPNRSVSFEAAGQPSVMSLPADDNVGARGIPAMGSVLGAGPASVVQLPEPISIIVGSEDVIVDYASHEDREAFRAVAPAGFFIRYCYAFNNDEFRFNFIPIQARGGTLDGLVRELKSVYGDGLNITDDRPNPSPYSS